MGSADFGQQFSVTVDGSVYAQPLVVGNTVVVTTERAKAYGINASTGAIIWQRSFGSPFQSSTIGCGDLTPDLGSTSTPVYDSTSGTVYLTTKIADGSTPQTPHWYLQAISITDGSERAGFPVTIQGSAANDPSVTFDPYVQMQRTGLLLSGGVVYAGFGSHCDIGGFRGWVAAVKVSGTPGVQSMWTAENSSASNGAGIWQAGGGLVTDGNDSFGPRIFLSTGNGLSPPAGPGTSPPGTLGDSVVRLGLDGSGQLAARDFFSPSNAPTLDVNDTDLGSGGPAALPASFGTTTHPHLLVMAGKDGRVFLLDRDQLGGRQQGPGGTDAVVQTLGPFSGVWGHPAVYPGEGGWVYFVGNAGPLRAFAASTTAGGDPALSAVGASTSTFPYTSGSPIVTSSGTTAGSAVVWVIYSTGSSGLNAQLRAYSAVPTAGVLNLLWSAPIGTASKFAMPASSGGRIYVGTRDGHLLAFGLPSASVLSGQPVDFGSAPVGSTVTATAHFVASAPIIVQGVSTTAPFAANASGLGLPKTLAAGGTLDVPVSFTPSTTGAATATLDLATDVGKISVDLHGVGTQTGLTASPNPVDFGTVATGTSKILTVLVTNSGTSAETVSGVTAPAAPFTAQNLPPAGTVINPQSSLSVSITYTPTVAATDTGSFAITTASGTLTTALSGTAITGQGHLTLTPTTLDFGSVPLGTSKTLSFDVSNTGNIPITITKAKAPSGAFTAASPLPEGLSIPVGDVVHQQVTFTPSAAGSVTASYDITADDGQGTQSVTLTGSGASTPPPPPPSGPAPGPATTATVPLVDRLAGADRYATAVAVSRATFAPGVSDVFIATGENFPDALAGAAAAGSLGAPVLLVPPGPVPADVQAELTRLQPAQITLLGGQSVISAATEAQLRTFAPTLRRLQGPDRYATAVAVSAAEFKPGVSDAFIATGLDFPDALAAAAAAGHLHAPILLVEPNQIPGAVTTELTRMKPAQITVIGGVGAVSAVLETQLRGLAPSVRRLGGVDRYATAAAVAAAVFPTATRVFLANGLNFPDALSGAPAAAMAPGPLLLTTSTCIPSSAGSTNGVLTQLTPTHVTLLGGTAVLGPAVSALTPCT